MPDYPPQATDTAQIGHTEGHSVTVSVFSDRHELMRAAAEKLTRSAEQAIATSGRFCWALAGGKTPEALYQLLANPPFSARIDWSRVHFFWSDERCVPAYDADSNYRMARESLLDRVQPPTEHVHRLQGELPPVLEAKRYEQELAQVVGLGASSRVPVLDLVLLGMGADGHTASLFPGATALNETERWVVATRIEGRDVARLTFTPTLINAAAQVLFLVSGADKARALAEVLAETSQDPLPARRIRPSAGELSWFVDHDAAILL